MDRPLHRVGLLYPAASLVGEQVHGMGRVVPQEVIGPASRLAGRVHVGAPEEERLDNQVLDIQIAGEDFPPDVLVAGIEAPGVAAHRDKARVPLHLDHGLGIAQAVGDWDFHFDVLARLQARDCLRGMQLRRRREDDGVHVFPRQRFLEVRRHVADAEAPATSCVLSRTRPTSETTRTPSMRASPSRCLTPNAPAPATPMFSVVIRVLENQMADGRVRRRHVVEAVHDVRRRAAGGTARDQPHHELDPLGARLSHVVDVRHLRESLGVVDDPVQKGRVPLLVDQAGARAVQLVAHPAGSPDVHVEILVVQTRPPCGSPCQADSSVGPTAEDTARRSPPAESRDTATRPAGRT